MNHFPAKRFPLSPMQLGMLFQSLYAPQSGVDIEQLVMTLPEELNTALFRKAFEALVERHEVLRARFMWEGLDEPAQEFQPCATLPFQEEDWSGLGEDARRVRLDSWLREDRLRGFDLSRPPLLRVALFRFGAADYRALWTFHHILIDGRAITALVRELFALYEAFRAGLDPDLRPPRPYSEFLEWLSRRDVNASAPFWRELLRGVTAPVQIDVGGSGPSWRPGEPEFGSAETRLSATLASALRAYSPAERIAMNIRVEAAWAILLSRYSREQDVVFGVTRACRRGTVEGSDSMIGMFINTLPMRARVRVDIGLAEFLADLHGQSSAIRPHEHTPLSRIRDWSEVAAGRPLFESIVVFELYDRGEALRALGGAWTARWFRMIEQTGYPLVLAMYDGVEPRVLLSYDRRRFDDGAMSRMLGHFVTLLEGMASGSFARLGELPLLTPAERERMLVEWNAERCDVPDACVHELFEREAERQPQQVAAVFEGRETSYGALDRRANRIAHQLRGLGVGPETTVGILAARSLELLAGMLGVLKAGGAYVPLDPAYPAERLRFMIDDSGARVLLADGDRAGGFTKLAVPVIPLQDAGDGYPEEPLESGVKPDNLAYVMYTSGSTGKPKAVEIEHRHVVGLLHSFRPLPASEGRRIGTSVSSFSWDNSVEEIFSCLCFGGTVHIVAPEHSTDAAYFAAYLAGHGINCSYVVPDMLEEIARELAARRGEAKLKCLITGLAPKRERLLQTVLEAVPGLRVINAYGPTEVTYGATAYDFTGTVNPDREVPIGKPYPNYQVYVVDSGLEPLPMGVGGELLIGGIGVARGYRNRPDITADRFIPDRFSGKPGARLYRTGDLARWTPDGNLEFLGRLDDQLKIRGYRIEPGEVQAALAQHESVERALVTARAGAAGDKRLVAYVLFKAGQAVPAPELRRFLKDRLPEYMLPSAFLPIESVPLMVSGKVDWKALPDPGWAAPQPEAAYAAPRDEMERLIAGTWAEVLGLPRVGIHDNFFELGGHSLVAVRLVSRLRTRCAPGLPVRAVFDEPTVEGLARVVRSLRPAARYEIERRWETGPAPLSYGQQQLWLLDRMAPASPAYNIPWATRLSGALDVRALRGALDALAARHEVLRTVFRETDDGPVQEVCSPGPVELREADLGSLDPEAREAEAQRRIAEEARRPFDLARDLPLRASLIRLGDEEHILLLVVHHIASDGWSAGVIARDLAALYESALRGETAALPGLPVQYADYALWQREQLAGPAMEKQLHYWKEHLAGAPILELPADYPAAAAPGGQGARVTEQLPSSLTEALRALGREEGATLFMTLLAGFQALLSRYTGQDDIVVGTPVANRERPEVQDLAGFFVNTLVMRGDLSGSPGFRDLLRRVRGTALAAYGNQDVPFEKLVEALHPGRTLGRNPLYQVTFAVESEPAVLRLPGLASRAVEVDTGTSKFDLGLTLTGTEDGFRATLEYNTGLFETATARRMLGHYRALLEAAVKEPERSVASLPLLNAEERLTILERWNDTRRKYPSLCIHELFERQALLRPDAVAVVCEERRLTYGELNRRASLLARRLRGLGVGPDVPVAVLLDRSPEMIVALLGILKAGGAYLPLEPGYPGERLSFMYRDTSAAAVVTCEALRHLSPAPEGRVVTVDSLAEEAGGGDGPASGATPRNLAYIVFTSGSTGTPKGVEVEHRGVVRLLFGVDYARFGEDEVFLQVAPVNFDASTFEIWGALLHGGRLVIYPDAVPTAGKLKRIVREQGITTVWLTTGLFHAVIDEVPDALLPVRQLITGGEVMSPARLRRAVECLPQTTLIHAYGPTESTTYTTCYRVPRPFPEGRASVPIGGPIGNTRVYVLDSLMQPVPVGVAGELYVGGDGLARGYRNRPELTSAHFIPDPFGGSGDRLYKTGDLVRWLPDGNLDFLGRRDEQVKIRGFRVEPGEVEAALAEQPGVQAAAVLAREGSDGVRRLLAYVAAPAGDVTAAGLETALRRRLPAYMIPSRFVILDELPRLASGKVDRRALPALEAVQPAEAGPAQATEDTVEGGLLKIWRSLLGGRTIGVEENFFELGGHSLLAVRLLARVERVFGVTLPLAALFEAPTVQRMAALIRDGAAPERVERMAALQPGGSRTALFSFGTGPRLLPLARRLGPDQPFFTLPWLDARELRWPPRMEDLAAASLKVLRAFQPEGPYVLAGWCNHGILAYEMAQQLAAEGQETSLVVLFDAANPVALKAALGRLSPAQRIGHLARKVAYHVSRMSSAGPAEAWRYFGHRVYVVRMFLARDLWRWRHARRAPESKGIEQALRDYRQMLGLASDQYEPRPYAGRVVLFRCTDRVLTPFREPRLGWDASLVPALDVRDVPGDHETMFEPPHVDVLAAILRECLEKR